MDWIDWLQQLDAGDWLIFGMILIVLEVLAPSSWLLWPGLAALVVAAVELVYPLGWTGQLLVFSLFTVLMLIFGRKFYNPLRITSAQPDLNDQLHRHARLLAPWAIYRDLSQ